jgi:hypothetical protein
MPFTALSNTDYFLNIATSILDSCADALDCNGLDVPERLYVGFDRPPQDCCPELTAWVGNIRPWDADFPDGRRAGNLQCHNGWSFDVTIRIGRCYVDIDEDGSGLDVGTLTDFTRPLYQDAAALLFGWVAQWRAGNVTELTTCDLVDIGALTQYHEGGCAGHEFTITVGVV